MDKETTYNLSYWESLATPVEPFKAEDMLTTGDGEISDQTTYKVSY